MKLSVGFSDINSTTWLPTIKHAKAIKGNKDFISKYIFYIEQDDIALATAFVKDKSLKKLKYVERLGETNEREIKP